MRTPQEPRLPSVLLLSLYSVFLNRNIYCRFWRTGYLLYVHAITAEHNINVQNKYPCVDATTASQCKQRHNKHTIQIVGKLQVHKANSLIGKRCMKVKKQRGKPWGIAYQDSMNSDMRSPNWLQIYKPKAMLQDIVELLQYY